MLSAQLTLLHRTELQGPIDFQTIACIQYPLPVMHNLGIDTHLVVIQIKLSERRLTRGQFQRLLHSGTFRHGQCKFELVFLQCVHYFYLYTVSHRVDQRVHKRHPPPN